MPLWLDPSQPPPERQTRQVFARIAVDSLQPYG